MTSRNFFTIYLFTSNGHAFCRTLIIFSLQKLWPLKNPYSSDFIYLRADHPKVICQLEPRLCQDPQNSSKGVRNDEIQNSCIQPYNTFHKLTSVCDEAFNCENVSKRYFVSEKNCNSSLLDWKVLIKCHNIAIFSRANYNNFLGVLIPECFQFYKNIP